MIVSCAKCGKILATEHVGEEIAYDVEGEPCGVYYYADCPECGMTQYVTVCDAGERT